MMRAKFQQNERARSFLLQTQHYEIGEASRSRVWGTGLKLHDDKNGDKKHWSGRNLTGMALMAVRNELL